MSPSQREDVNDAELVDIHRQRIEALSGQPAGAGADADARPAEEPGAAPTDAGEAAGGDTSPCASVCEPAHGICESADVICEVAERNPALPRFRTDCTWAGEECRHAQAQCDACR